MLLAEYFIVYPLKNSGLDQRSTPEYSKFKNKVSL